MNLLEINSRYDKYCWLDKYVSEEYSSIRNRITRISDNFDKFTGVSDEELYNMSKEELVAKLKEEYIRRFSI